MIAAAQGGPAYVSAGQVYRNRVGAVMTVEAHAVTLGIKVLGPIYLGTTENPDGPRHEWLFTAEHLADCGYVLVEDGAP